MRMCTSDQNYFVYVIVSLLLIFSMQGAIYAQNLDVTEPRTVRLIYFLPNDRPFRQEVVDSMKAVIRYAQTFYSEQMQSHGYSNRTFQFEVDGQGEPLVHRVDGRFSDAHYGYKLGKVAPGQEIVDNQYLSSTLKFIVYDLSVYNLGETFASGGRVGKNSGSGEYGAELILAADKSASISLYSGEYNFLAVIHDLGHAFGLNHDWRDGTYIMSYGPGWNRLSACAADFLAVHPYFNHDIPLKDGPPPTVELISSPGYAPGSTSVPIRLKVNDSDGIHQVILMAQGGLKACKGLNGEQDVIVEFNYDGVIPSASDPNRIGTSLSSPLVHLIEVEAVDINGDVGSLSFELYDVSTRDDHVATFEGHGDRVASVAFSPDGAILASASWDYTFKLWNVETQQIIATFGGYESDVSAVAFSTDGTLAVGSNKLELWDVETQQNIATFERGNISALAFSPDGTLLASGSWGGTIMLWDIGTQQNIATFKGHVGAVTSIAISTSGILASGGGDGDKTLKLWDVETQQNIATLGGRGHVGAVSAVAFSPDGTTLAFGGAFGWIDVQLLDVETLTNIATFKGHRSNIFSIAYSPDGTMLISGSLDGTVRLWDVPTGHNTATFKAAGEVPSVAFFPDGTMVAAGTSSGVVELWAVPSGALVSNNPPVFTAGHLTTRKVDETTSVGVGIGTPVSATDADADTLTYSLGGTDAAAFSIDRNTGQLKTGTILGADTKPTYTVIITVSDGSLSASITVVINVTMASSADVNGDGAVVSISPAAVASPGVGQNLTLSLKVANSENVAGYQASVSFETTALRFVSGENGDFLPAGAFFVEPKVEGNLIRFNAASLAGESDGDGTLAEFTFEVIAVKESTLTLSDVLLTDSTGKTSAPQIENAQITKTQQLKGDVNGDGVVNIADLVLVAGELNKTGQNAADVNGDGVVNIADLVLVAGELNKGDAAPSLHLQSFEMLTAADVRQWLSEAQQLKITGTTSQRGILFLQQLLKALTPEQTALLPNFPNPFNPETWIPYQLAKSAEVKIVIYASDGKLVRTLDLGHQPVGIYRSKSSAAYWDGKNAQGEPVASGVYYYTLSAGRFTATRKMLIRK